MLQFVDRFYNATLEVPNLSVQVAISAMLQGTQLISLQESLSLDPPASLADLFVKVNRYILHTKIMRNVGGNEDREWKRKEHEGEENSIQLQGKAKRIDEPNPSLITTPGFYSLDQPYS